MAAMASPPSARPEQPHIVSLVLQSKKALQHGEQLCSRSSTLSNASAQSAVDVLALDAKVRWISEAILEQLKLAASVAKSIEEKRTFLSKQVQGWDASRTKHTDALDAILDSLGAQLVPPDFHQSSADSSLFGSQHSDEDLDKRLEGGDVTLVNGRTASRSLETVRNGHKGKDYRSLTDRKRWKTLRDFVDDQGIEDILENIESDRAALDDILSKTDEYPETLTTTISSITASLPQLTHVVSIEDIVSSQDGILNSMAVHLESLASHYDQMAGALRESEAGETFSEEDLQDMNRDTDELPSIMAELDHSAKSIDAHHEQILTVQDGLQKHLDHLHSTLDDLDELGEIMTEMLETQENIQVRCGEELDSLREHLLTLEHLHERFLAYQTSFSKLILELARRQQYREAAENIVRGMVAQLDAMTQEENQVRSHFNEEHGAHLPEDICLCIGNPPTRWDVTPWSGEGSEVLPDIADDLIAEARDRISIAEGVLGTESL